MMKSSTLPLILISLLFVFACKGKQELAEESPVDMAGDEAPLSDVLEIQDEEDGLWELEAEPTEPDFVIVETMPIAPGCENIENQQERNKCSFNFAHDFVLSNVIWPQGEDVEGTIYVTYVIDQQGKVDDIAITRGVDPDFDKAAIVAVKKLPQFTPGKQAGHAVRVRFTAAVPIVLD